MIHVVIIILFAYSMLRTCINRPMKSSRFNMLKELVCRCVKSSFKDANVNFLIIKGTSIVHFMSTLLQNIATMKVLSVGITTVWSLPVSMGPAQMCVTLMTTMQHIHCQWQPAMHRDWNMTVSADIELSSL